MRVKFGKLLIGQRFREYMEIRQKKFESRIIHGGINNARVGELPLFSVCSCVITGFIQIFTSKIIYSFFRS